jgi:cobalt/nickel transport system ATP-binding protein
MTAPVSVNALNFQYPDGTQALDNVGFTLDYGEKTALLGANGAGKTTLLHLLAGLEMPVSGSISIAGEPLNLKTRRHLHRRIGLVFQNPDHQLFCPTLLEDVRFGPRNMGLAAVDIDAAVESALVRTGLWDKRHKEPWRLSYGERKRGALAAVLAMNPEILLLDEPSAFLDSESNESLESILRELNITMILATQDLYLAHSVCTRGVYLDNGRLVADQPLRKLLSRRDLFRAGRRVWRRQMQMGCDLGWEDSVHD